MQCLLPQITRICNVFEGVADLGDHLVFRYILPKHFCFDLVNKLLQLQLLGLPITHFLTDWNTEAYCRTIGGLYPKPALVMRQM